MKLKEIYKYCLVAICTGLTAIAWAQGNNILVVLDIPAKGIVYDATQIGNLIRTELGKTGAYQVLSIAEAEQTLKKAGLSVNECYHKTCLFESAKALNAGKVLS